MNLLESFLIIHPTELQKKQIISPVDAYFKSGILTKNSVNEATHVACATIMDSSAVISHNMKHMVNRQNQFNVLNLQILEKQLVY